MVHPWTSYQNNQYNNDEVLFLVRTVNEKVSYVYSINSTVYGVYFCTITGNHDNYNTN